METILNEHVEKIEQLNHLIDDLFSQSDDYQRLLDYYYSDQRQEDLEEDAKGKLDHLNRGVLSEDAIYNLMADYYDTSIKMLELSTKILKIK